MAISINPERGLAYLGKADCLRYMGQYGEAAKIYTKAMECENFVQSAALLKRAISYIENKDLDEAMNDLNEVLEQDPINSEAFYFKGLLYYK